MQEPECGHATGRGINSTLYSVYFRGTDLRHNDSAFLSAFFVCFAISSFLPPTHTCSLSALSELTATHLVWSDILFLGPSYSESTFVLESRRIENNMDYSRQEERLN